MAQRSYIVGIAGGSASGKSTFTRALQACIEGAQPARALKIFHTDHYFFRDKAIGPTFISAATGEEHFNCNHPDSVDRTRLLRDVQECIQAPDAPAIVVLEGLMVLHDPKTRELLDLRLFVELDADERALRRMIRDMGPERGNGKPEFIATYYRESARVGHALYVEPSRVYADLILRGDASPTRLAPMVHAVIEQGIAALAEAG